MSPAPASPPIDDPQAPTDERRLVRLLALCLLAAAGLTVLTLLV